MEQIPLLGCNGCDAVLGVLGWVMHSHQSSQVSTSTHLLVNLIWNLARLVPFSHIGLNLGADPLANFLAEGGMGFVVVWRVVLKSVNLHFYSYLTGTLHQSTNLGRQKEPDLQMDLAAQPLPQLALA